MSLSGGLVTKTCDEVVSTRMRPAEVIPSGTDVAYGVLRAAAAGAATSSDATVATASAHATPRDPNPASVPGEPWHKAVGHSRMRTYVLQWANGWARPPPRRSRVRGDPVQVGSEPCEGDGLQLVPEPLHGV